MSKTTYFVALPFVTTRHGEILPGRGVECPTAAEAEAHARLLARTPPICGAVAFSRTGSNHTGEFADARVLLTVGDVLTIDELIALEVA